MIDFENKVTILADLYSNYKEDKGFSEFIEYNDLGLPLAYLTNEGLVVEMSEDGARYLQETWELFIASLGLEDESLSNHMNLDDLLAISLGDLE